MLRFQEATQDRHNDLMRCSSYIPVVLILIAGCADTSTPVTKQTATDRQSKHFIIGKVVRVADGDTFTILDETGTQHRVRLQGIDSPERTMPYSKRAREALNDAVSGKTVEVRYDDRDQFDRVLGDVFVGTHRINLELVRAGWAWHYKRYSDDPDLAEAEEEARREKRGLWKDSDPLPPWEFRQRKRVEEDRQSSAHNHG